MRGGLRTTDRLCFEDEGTMRWWMPMFFFIEERLHLADVRVRDAQLLYFHEQIRSEAAKLTCCNILMRNGVDRIVRDGRVMVQVEKVVEML